MYAVVLYEILSDFMAIVILSLHIFLTQVGSLIIFCYNYLINHYDTLVILTIFYYIVKKLDVEPLTKELKKELNVLKKESNNMNRIFGTRLNSIERTMFDIPIRRDERREEKYGREEKYESKVVVYKTKTGKFHHTAECKNYSFNMVKMSISSDLYSALNQSVFCKYCVDVKPKNINVKKYDDNDLFDVYITPRGGTFHRLSDCRYIKNSFTLYTIPNEYEDCFRNLWCKNCA